MHIQTHYLILNQINLKQFLANNNTDIEKRLVKWRLTQTKKIKKTPI